MSFAMCARAFVYEEKRMCVCWRLQNTTEWWKTTENRKKGTRKAQGPVFRNSWQVDRSAETNRNKHMETEWERQREGWGKAETLRRKRGKLRQKNRRRRKCTLEVLCKPLKIGYSVTCLTSEENLFFICGMWFTSTVVAHVSCQQS